jgi:hypothetical protein
MQVLKQNDCFIGGTEKQYKEIFKIVFYNTEFGLSVRKQNTNNAVIRGGVFWSERCNTVIAGSISGNKLTLKEFKERLINTIGN